MSDVDIVPVHAAELRYALVHLFDLSGVDLTLADETYATLDEAEQAAAAVMAAIAGSCD